MVETASVQRSVECWAAWLVVTTEQTTADFLLYWASTKDVMKAAMKACKLDVLKVLYLVVHSVKMLAALFAVLWDLLTTHCHFPFHSSTMFVEIPTFCPRIQFDYLQEALGFYFQEGDVECCWHCWSVLAAPALFCGLLSSAEHG